MRRFLICSLVVLSFFSSDLFAADFYVDPTGTDNPVCSQFLPCRQIRQPLTFAMAGDTIFVADGQYLGFDVDSITATQANPFNIRAQGLNAQILSTTDRTDNRDNILVRNSEWVSIEGLNSSNAPRSGLRVDTSNNVTISNGTFSDNGTWGVFTNHSNDLVIENNVLSGSVSQHGLYISNSGDRHQVTGNIIFGNNANGIHLNGDLSAGGNGSTIGDGIITNVVVEKNIIYDNGTGGGAGINFDGVQNAVIKNNLLYDNHASGIALFQSDGAAGPSDILVANNTIDMASDGRWALRVTDSEGTVSNVNNIFYNRHPVRGAISLAEETSPQLNNDVTNLISDYNIFDNVSPVGSPDDGNTRYDLPDWQLTFGKDPNSFSADPDFLFVDLDNRDYRLRDSSLAIDRGVDVPGVTEDLLSTARPQQLAYDIGAYERQAAAVPEPMTLVMLAGGLGGLMFRKKHLEK